MGVGSTSRSGDILGVSIRSPSSTSFAALSSLHVSGLQDFSCFRWGTSFFLFECQEPADTESTWRAWRSCTNSSVRCVSFHRSYPQSLIEDTQTPFFFNSVRSVFQVANDGRRVSRLLFESTSTSLWLTLRCMQTPSEFSNDRWQKNDILLGDNCSKG